MDRERRKKWRTIKLAATEFLMVAAVIVTVVILTFVAMGYKVEEDGEVGQQGLIQVQSYPTGATVTIDGDTLLAHTNTSKLVSAGEHAVTLTKDGYESWTKTVVAEPGILLKLAYPRLFLQNRVAEKIREYDTAIDFFIPALNYDSVVYATGGSKKWILLDVRGDGAVSKELDLSGLLGDKVVDQVVWNNNNDKLLVSAKNDDAVFWYVVNTKNVENSISLTEEFGIDFSEVLFYSDDGERLLSVTNGDLRVITLSDKNVSQVLANDVVDLAIREDRIVYITSDNQVKFLKKDEGGDVLVVSFNENQTVRVLLSSYLDKKYITFSVDNKLYIYAGESLDKTHELKDMELLVDNDVGFAPLKLFVEADGGLVVANNGKNLAIFDAETRQLYNYEVKGNEHFFVDKYLIGTIDENRLIISDFDNTNERVMSTATGRAFITKNNKWLYYLRVDNGKSNIFREQIMD